MTSDIKIKRLYEESTNTILLESRYMLSEIDKGDFDKSITHAYNIFLSLATDQLDTKTYEDLYWFIQDETLPLLRAFWDLYNTNKLCLETWYDNIQHKPKVVPRLYLLVIFGSLIMRKNSSLFESIAFDILDMCLAIQAPIKGLYLRKFLLHTLDISSHFDNSNGVKFEILSKFLLQNFRNMNKLWVRLTYKMYYSDQLLYRTAHGKLKILIHSCIKEISELKGLTCSNYCKDILPELLLDVVNCNERYSQNILIEYIAELFLPKLNVHATTFLIQQSKKFQPDFDYQAFISELCYYTSEYMVSPKSNENEYIDNHSALHTLFNCVVDLQDNLNQSYSVSDRLNIYKSILVLLIKFLPSELSFISELLCKAHEQLAKSITTENSVPNSPTIRELREFLYKLIASSLNLNEFVSMKSFIPLVKYLDNREQDFIANEIATHITTNSFMIQTMDQFLNISKLMDLLLIPPKEPSKESSSNVEAYSTIIVSLNANDISTQTEFYSILKTKIANASCNVRKYLCPVVLNSIMKFINSIRHDRGNSVGEEIISSFFKFIREFIFLLPRPLMSGSIIQFLLLAATLSDNFNIPQILKFSDSFIRDAFTISEEDLVNSHEQLLSLNSFVNCLYSIKNLEPDAHDQLSQRCERLAAAFVSYSNQCYALIHVSQLYWRVFTDNGEKTIKSNPENIKRCLDRSVRVISSCIGEITKVSLFSDLINICCYYFEEKCSIIDNVYIESIVEKAQAEIALIGNENDRRNILDHFELMTNYYHKISAVIG